MTPVALRHDVTVTTENPWVRLHRIAEARRHHLHLTQTGVQNIGGPSPAWINKLTREEGAPSVRHAPHLRRLDAALRWPEGTALSLVRDDRSGWSEDVLADEEQSLIEAHDVVDEFLLIVGNRLRSLPEGQRKGRMSAILDALAIEDRR